MSRVSYVMLHPGADGRAHRRRSAGASTTWSATSARQAGAEREDVLELTIVGNPIMHHLVFGLDPTELGGAPFALTTDEALRVPGPRPRAARRARRARLRAAADRRPRRRRHRGRDPVGGAARPGRPRTSSSTSGTNAEIVLGNRDRLLAASSPTGPAFEGAQISCGQRAAPGAIERVRIDRDDARAAVHAWSATSAGPTTKAAPDADRRLRLGDHRARRRAVPRGRDHARGRDRRRRSPRGRRGWSPDEPDVLVRAAGGRRRA